MRIKWLIILFIFFLGVILLSLWITQQSQKSASLFEKEIPVTEQAESRTLPVYSPQVRPASITALPSGENGITIIKAPPIELTEENSRVSKIENKEVNNVSSGNIASSTPEQDSSQFGSTKIGKQPTSKEAQEMNSSGIVLY